MHLSFTFALFVLEEAFYEIWKNFPQYTHKCAKMHY